MQQPQTRPKPSSVEKPAIIEKPSEKPFTVGGGAGSPAEAVSLPSGNPLLALYGRLQCKDLIQGKRIICVKETNTVMDAVKALGDNRIQSCPVLDENGACAGLIDVVDLLEWVDSHAPQDDRYDFTRRRHEEERVKAGAEIRNATIKQVMNFSGKNPYFSFKESASMTEVFQKLCGGVNRVCIENDQGHLVGIITMSDCLRFMYQNIHNDQLAQFRETPVSDLHLTARPIEVVTEDSQLKEAIRMLRKQGGGSIAVVDSNNGRLLANFSASDMKGLFLDDAPRFTTTVLGFLRRVSPRQADQPKVVTPESKIGQCIKMMILSRVHALWILSQHEQPIGCVTMRDILSFSSSLGGARESTSPPSSSPTSSPSSPSSQSQSR